MINLREVSYSRSPIAGENVYSGLQVGAPGSLKVIYRERPVCPARLP